VFGRRYVTADNDGRCVAHDYWEHDRRRLNYDFFGRSGGVDTGS